MEKLHGMKDNSRGEKDNNVNNMIKMRMAMATRMKLKLEQAMVTMELEQALGLSAMHSTQCKFEQSCRHLKPIGNTSRNYSLMRMKMRRLRIQIFKKNAK